MARTKWQTREYNGSVLVGAGNLALAASFRRGWRGRCVGSSLLETLQWRRSERVSKDGAIDLLLGRKDAPAAAVHSLLLSHLLLSQAKKSTESLSKSTSAQKILLPEASTVEATRAPKSVQSTAESVYSTAESVHSSAESIHPTPESVHSSAESIQAA